MTNFASIPKEKLLHQSCLCA